MRGAHANTTDSHQIHVPQGRNWPWPQAVSGWRCSQPAAKRQGKATALQHAGGTRQSGGRVCGHGIAKKK